MSISEAKREVVKSCLTSNYLPALLREYKSGWIIEYYAQHPVSKKLERKKVKLTRLFTRYKSVKDARMHANRIIMALNIKLGTGWNPFFEEEDARLYTSVSNVCEAFLKEKGKELREDSMRSYKSFVNIFSSFIKNHSTIEYFSMITKTTTIIFLEHIYMYPPELG
jgi:hypothetical protein